MRRFESRDTANGGEAVGQGGGGPFRAIAMKYLPTASLPIQMKILQVVVKIDVAGAKVTTKKSRVRGKNWRNEKWKEEIRSRFWPDEGY